MYRLARPRPSRLASYSAASAWRTSTSALTTIAVSMATPDAGADVGHAGVDDERLAQRLDQPVGEVVDLARGGELLAHHHELVAAEPGDHVAPTNGGGEPLGDDAQQLVAGSVTERVVDHLESVEIEEQHGDLLLAPGGARQRLVQQVEQLPTVDQTGERIVRRAVQQLGLGGLQRGDVEDLQRGVHRRAEAVVDQRQGQLGVHDLPVGTVELGGQPTDARRAGDDLGEQLDQPLVIDRVDEIRQMRPDELAPWSSRVTRRTTR